MPTCLKTGSEAEGRARWSNQKKMAVKELDSRDPTQEESTRSKSAVVLWQTAQKMRWFGEREKRGTRLQSEDGIVGRARKQVRPGCHVSRGR